MHHLGVMDEAERINFTTARLVNLRNGCSAVFNDKMWLIVPGGVAIVGSCGLELVDVNRPIEFSDHSCASVHNEIMICGDYFEDQKCFGYNTACINLIILIKINTQ